MQEFLDSLTIKKECTKSTPPKDSLTTTPEHLVQEFLNNLTIEKESTNNTPTKNKDTVSSIKREVMHDIDRQIMYDMALVNIAKKEIKTFTKWNEHICYKAIKHPGSTWETVYKNNISKNMEEKIKTLLDVLSESI